MPKEETQFNSETAKEAQKKMAVKRKGMTYYTTQIKDRFVKSRDVKQIPLNVAKRLNFLTNELAKDDLEDAKREKHLEEIKALSTLHNKFLDKTFATQFESDNRNHDTSSITINTVQPDPPEPEHE